MKRAKEIGSRNWFKIRKAVVQRLLEGWIQGELRAVIASAIRMFGKPRQILIDRGIY